MVLYREFTLLKKLQMKLKQTLDLIVGYHSLINPIPTQQYIHHVTQPSWNRVNREVLDGRFFNHDIMFKNY